LYHKEYGVQQDYSVAFKLYNLSADQGFPKAHFNLGLMYSRGEVSLRIAKLRPSGGLNNLHPGESEFCGEIGVSEIGGSSE